MRDPLPRLSVRYKLALMFVGVSLIAFGVGGVLVSQWAEDALESEILSRLDFESRAYGTAFDARLALLARRSEDFASDGLIRGHTDRLQPTGGRPAAPAARAALADELRRHLALNKLPLEPAFLNLAVATTGGELLVAVHDDPARRLDGLVGHDAPGPTPVMSGLVGGDDDRPPGLVLSTPLLSLDGTGRVGWLAVLVDARRWVSRSIDLAAAGDLGDGDGRRPPAELSLRDGAGRRLVTSLGAAGPGPLWLDADDSAGASPTTFLPVRGSFTRSFPLAAGAWSVEVYLDAAAAMRPVTRLRSSFMGIAIVLTLASSLLLFFPMRFLARPLRRLTRAAERLREGEFETRVEVESHDEIGELAHAFNAMASAIQERTSRLEDVASELRVRQAQIAEGRDRLAAVISSMQDALIVLDGQGEVAMANEAAGPLLELVGEGAEARGRHLCREAPPADSRPTDCFACLFAADTPARSCVIDVGPRTFEVHSTSLPRDAAGGQGRVLVAREVTDRIQRDERDIHNERLAVLGEVAAVMAHEINNPLASISLFNQMLASELPDGSPLLENTEVIGRNTDTAKRVIRELLDYATGATPETGPLDVHETLDDVVRFLRPLADRAGVVLRFQPAASDATVTGDEVQLRQVFVNLAMNAIQAVAGRSLAPGTGRAADAPDAGEPPEATGGIAAGRGPRATTGEPSRDATRAAQATTGGKPPREVTLATRDVPDRLVVEVRDSGPGILPEDRERIFRPFFTTRPRGEGTGLGLPTARRIVEMHGGSLVLSESSPAGTTFVVALRPRGPEGPATGGGAGGATAGTGRGLGGGAGSGHTARPSGRNGHDRPGSAS